MTLLLDRPQPTPVSAAAGDLCSPECLGHLDCAFCQEAVPCEHADVHDGREPAATCRGVAHHACHVRECTDRSCWADTDAGWHAAHEW